MGFVAKKDSLGERSYCEPQARPCQGGKSAAYSGIRHLESSASEEAVRGGRWGVGVGVEQKPPPDSCDVIKMQQPYSVETGALSIWLTEKRCGNFWTNMEKKSKSIITFNRYRLLEQSMRSLEIKLSLVLMVSMARGHALGKTGL